MKNDTDQSSNNPDETRRLDLLDAAARWEKVADSEEKMARWNRKQGFDLSLPGRSAGDVRAEIDRRCVRTLRLEAATGVSHCMCHEKPSHDCPSGGMGYPITE